MISRLKQPIVTKNKLPLIKDLSTIFNVFYFIQRKLRKLPSDNTDDI